MNQVYIISERFIWDDLLARAGVAQEHAKKMWQKKRKLPPLVLSWPAETIKDDSGRTINDMVALQVPADVPLMRALTDMMTRTKAYALLICTATEDELRVVLESHHGVRCWTTPIERHGDVRVLGKTRVQDGQGGYGLLWHKSPGSD